MQKIDTKEIQEKARRRDGKGDPLGIVQEIRIWTDWHLVYIYIYIYIGRKESVKKVRPKKILLDFEIVIDH